jgi:hypothetical protein
VRTHGPATGHLVRRPRRSGGIRDKLFDLPRIAFSRTQRGSLHLAVCDNNYFRLGQTAMITNEGLPLHLVHGLEQRMSGQR